MKSSAALLIATFAANQWRTPGVLGDHPVAARLAYRAFLDTIAVAIAGQREQATELTRAYTATLGLGGLARDWGTGASLPPESAALINGVAAHVLDFDDVMTPMRAHISATLVPALAALAPQINAKGHAYAAAFIAGFEVMAKFARVMALDHYTKGWHSTSALGILGTTTACCVLLKLDEKKIAHALGLAVAQAAGTRENFGAMAKSFQSAQCAAAAIRATLLAKQGFTAADQAIDGRYGYMNLYANNEDLSARLAELGLGLPEILQIGLDLKKYPCCYAVHRALDGALDIKRVENIASSDITKIEVLTSAGGMQALRSELPTTGLQAKFSMQYTVAAAMIDGRIGLSSFTDEAVNRASVLDLAKRVSLTEATGTILPRWSEIRIHLTDGQTHFRRVSLAHGDAADPLTDEELIEKAVDCFAWAGWSGDSKAFAHKVLNMKVQEVSEIITACRALNI